MKNRTCAPPRSAAKAAALAVISLGVATLAIANAEASTPNQQTQAYVRQLSAGPLASYTLTPSQVAAAVATRSDLLSQCMAKAGFSYHDPSASSVATMLTQSDERVYGLENQATAATYGYHLPALVDRPNEPTTASDSMSADELKAFEGSAATWQTSRPDARGCVGLVEQQLGTSADDLAHARTAERIQHDAYSAARTDASVAAATTAWSACMKRSGYNYASPLASIADPAWSGTTVTKHERDVASADVKCSVTTNVQIRWHQAENTRIDRAMASGATAAQVKSEARELARQQSEIDNRTYRSLDQVEAPRTTVTPNTGRNVGGGGYPDTFCAPYKTACLFYDHLSFGGSAWFVPPKCAIPNESGYVFNKMYTGFPRGYGAPTINNAAGAVNGSAYTFYIYYNQNYSGNYDYMASHTIANFLSYTLNNDASQLIYGC